MALLPGSVFSVLRQGKRIGDGSSISSVVPAKSIVVPANAGTHTPWALKWKMEPTPCDKNCRLWLWVPAFAGTTHGELVREDHTDAVVTPPSTTMVCPVMKLEASEPR